MNAGKIILGRDRRGRMAGRAAVCALLAMLWPACCIAPASASAALSGPQVFGWGFNEPQAVSSDGTHVWVANRPAAAQESITSVAGRLTDVSADSTSDAWAVGAASAGGALTLHWNGTSWTKVTNPSPSSVTELGGVSALSPTDAWAVGSYNLPANPAVANTLALHWDGTSWAQVATPNPGGTNYHGTTLTSVSALSSSDAWAVGSYSTSAGLFRTLVLHWDGTNWTQVASPEPGMSSFLMGVSADSTSDAWAVGSYLGSDGVTIKTLVVHWDGTNWTKVTAPNSGTSPELNGVSAVSSSHIFAVGKYSTATSASHNLALEGNGTTWTNLPTPDPSSYSFLADVSAVSASEAWAVGSYATSPGSVGHTLLIGWNGSTWTKVTTPNPGRSNGSHLEGVGASSASNAWAVGYYLTNTNALKGLILHWNGQSWTRS